MVLAVVWLSLVLGEAVASDVLTAREVYARYKANNLRQGFAFTEEYVTRSTESKTSLTVRSVNQCSELGTLLNRTCLFAPEGKQLEVLQLTLLVNSSGAWELFPRTMTAVKIPKGNLSASDTNEGQDNESTLIVNDKMEIRREAETECYVISLSIPDDIRRRYASNIDRRTKRGRYIYNRAKIIRESRILFFISCDDFLLQRRLALDEQGAILSDRKLNGKKCMPIREDEYVIPDGYHFSLPNTEREYLDVHEEMRRKEFQSKINGISR